MNWLNKIVDEVIAAKPSGEIIVESGISPSGSYHMGYLREIITCDAVVLELRRRGREARHIHFVDDLDGFRKVPVNLPPEYEKYLGIPLCDIPASDGSSQSYADYSLKDFLDNVKKLGIEIDVIRSHEKYREGFFVETIEQALQKIEQTKKILEEVSGRKLDEQWSPIQVNEGGYLKKRPFISINTKDKTINYLDKDGQEQSTQYTKGEVKLDWRLDWPARWELLGVDIEPFGRDHATKGGSYDTGKALVQEIFGGKPPIPIPYEFVNKAGDTQKMSASKGNGIMMNEVTVVLPPEISRFLILKTSPDKTIFFDPVGGAVRLVDEFAELLGKENKSEDEKHLLELCQNNIGRPTVSSVPFSHLVASYQAALRDPGKTLDIIARTEHNLAAKTQKDVILAELKFIDEWLKLWAPEDVKFELLLAAAEKDFSEKEKQYFSALADKIENAPSNAEGEWFHKAIYEFKESGEFSPKELFTLLYKLLIGKESGPRAGWFLSILSRDWLISRLRLEK